MGDTQIEAIVKTEADLEENRRERQEGEAFQERAAAAERFRGSIK